MYAQSEFKRRLDANLFKLPKPENVPMTEYELPYVLVGDDAFPLLTNLMKPYSRHSLTKEELVFNYRLSKARRVVENTFGILANRFRILLTILLQPEKSAIVVLLLLFTQLINLFIFETLLS